MIWYYQPNQHLSQIPTYPPTNLDLPNTDTFLFPLFLLLFLSPLFSLSLLLSPSFSFFLLYIEENRSKRKSKGKYELT